MLWKFWETLVEHNTEENLTAKSVIALNKKNKNYFGWAIEGNYQSIFW